MKLQNLATLVAIVPYALGFPNLANFPEYRSLAGLSAHEVRAVARTFSSTPGAQPLPPPHKDTSSKLVYDSAHPFQPDQPGDLRGPCPGLNTLASHGVSDLGDLGDAISHEHGSFLKVSAPFWRGYSGPDHQCCPRRYVDHNTLEVPVEISI